MRNILSSGALLFFMSSLVFAQVESDVISLDGIIVDCNTMNNDKRNFSASLTSSRLHDYF